MHTFAAQQMAWWLQPYSWNQQLRWTLIMAWTGLQPYCSPCFSALPPNLREGYIYFSTNQRSVNGLCRSQEATVQHNLFNQLWQDARQSVGYRVLHEPRFKMIWRTPTYRRLYQQFTNCSTAAVQSAIWMDDCSNISGQYLVCSTNIKRPMAVFQHYKISKPSAGLSAENRNHSVCNYVRTLFSMDWIEHPHIRRLKREIYIFRSSWRK